MTKADEIGRPLGSGSTDRLDLVPEWSPELEHSDSAVARLVYSYDDADPHGSEIFMGMLRDAAKELVAAERERCAALVPDNWLDPLLTGPQSLVRATDNHRMVEDLLRAVAERIRRGPNRQ